MPLELLNSRRTVEPPAATDSKDAESTGPANIDLERAAWDPEYRRQVLAILRQTGRSDGAAQPEPRAEHDSIEKQP